ncbi:MAG: ABC transporter permease [Firmicutes bacterium]|nr:ABC transporter permease [Bacillota bacterium]
MRNCVKLAVSYIRYYWKQAFILFLGISMSVLLLSGIASLMHSERMADYENAKDEYGSWDYRVPIPENHKEKNSIAMAGDGFQVKCVGYFCSYPLANPQKEIALCYGDGDYLKLTGRTLLEGEYPKKAGEVALDYYALHNLEAEYKLGSKLELGGKPYRLTGVLSKGMKTDSNAILAFVDQATCQDNQGKGMEALYYISFSEGKDRYRQFDAFVKKNHINHPGLDVNDGTALYTGAEPKETIGQILRTALRLPEGRLIYLMGTLNNNNDLLYHVVLAVLFIFGGFMIFSIFQVIVERRMSQYGMLEVLGAGQKELFISLLTELILIFLPGYLTGSALGNLLARLLYPGRFRADVHTFAFSFLAFGLFLVVCCVLVLRNMKKYTQVEKMKQPSSRVSRKIRSRKRRGLTWILSKRFLLEKRSCFIRVVISLSLGGVLLVCTSYVADNTKENNAHAMVTDQGLYTDISVTIEDDDLGKVIPAKVAENVCANNKKEIESFFPISYTLGEIPLKDGKFQWTEFYPEVAENPMSDEKPDPEIMKKYGGIATKQGSNDFKLKVNVYGYGAAGLSELSDYVLEGTIKPENMVSKNQVVLKTLMDGGGHYDGIDIKPGDTITVKVPKEPGDRDPKLLKFQAGKEHYVEKDFEVAAVVSRCVGENDVFIGAGPSVVSVIMPQEMMESNFGISDYNSLNINAAKSFDSSQVIDGIRPLLSGLRQCVIHDYSGSIEKKNEILAQKASFFYGIGIILFLISLLHAMNSMKHQIQSRQYEFGILRAMGITEQRFRGMLIRQGLFYGLAASACMILLTIICKAVLAEILQHIIRYIIVSQNIPLFPCLIMMCVNTAVCVTVMLVAGNGLLRRNVVEELKG